MKLKYYMRGIGIGMIVTALFFMIGASTTNKMSDEEILARAKELGLVEKTVLKEASSILAEQKDAEDTEESFAEGSELTADEVSETTSESLAEESTETDSELDGSETQAENDSEEIEEYVVISVISGDSSVSVSQKVYEAGLVENATEFDRFLCSNGYDRSLRVGQHEIQIGSTMQEIAEALSGR